MKNYPEIRQMAETKRTELFTNVGLFFAFSNEQFTANKTPKKEDEKYVSIGAGGYLPKSKVDDFLTGMETIYKWEKSEIKKSKELKESHILYELQNHECFYTGSIEGACDVLPYKPAEIWQVYNKHKETEMQSF